MKIPEPRINHISKDVYAPSDDSFLMIDYFRDHLTSESFDGINIKTINNVVDIGTGSGIIAIFFEHIKTHVMNFNPRIVASDVSLEALNCAQLNAEENNKDSKIQFIQSNLFESFPHQLTGKFEIITFNPPYLPSINAKVQKLKHDLSWNGGLTGLEIISTFLESAKEFLNPKRDSYLYLISSSSTSEKKLSNIILQSGFKREKVKQTHIFFESIFLNRLRLILN